MLTELKNRGVDDVFFLICDGLKGLPDAVGAVWPLAIVQTCVVHLLRNTFRHASKKDWDAIKRDAKPIYTAPSAAAAAAARDAMLDKWEARYPAIRRLWMDAWERFIPFLDYDVEIRRVICTTNAIESLNARFKRSIRARGHFPDEQAALKCMYLTVCLCSISCCGFSHDDFSGLGRACRPRNGLNWMVLVSPPERTGKDYDQHAPSTVYPSFAAERGIRRVDRAENTCQRADGA